LLHAGHVKYLKQARALGDFFLLGLNSDAFICRLKGNKRPLLDESERSRILAALDCVDYLTILDEATLLELLRVVQLKIMVKGGDCQLGEVVRAGPVCLNSQSRFYKWIEPSLVMPPLSEAAS
jgi:D-beta-D-heptose 7-phosphate kinase/D-beta-D-heptose 1-phosphate adenosyltransferase